MNKQKICPLRLFSTVSSGDSRKRLSANVLNVSYEAQRRSAVYLRTGTSDFFAEFCWSYCADFRTDFQPTIPSWGSFYGVIWWILGAQILNADFSWDAAICIHHMPPIRMVAVGSLVGHLIFGSILGASFLWLSNRRHSCALRAVEAEGKCGADSVFLVVRLVICFSGGQNVKDNKP